jgi:hypothetical protein
MCYNVESSLKTSLLSLFTILYLLSSNDPHYKWIALTLVGWCLMQFAEMLLWFTEPRKDCTDANKLITMTLIPTVLILQPLGALLGSLFVIPWSKSSDIRKNFLILYPALIIALVCVKHFYKPEKVCTTVTPGGHLFWRTVKHENSPLDMVQYVIWSTLIMLPLLIFWDKSFAVIVLLCVLPIFGFNYGFLTSDSRGSIWCYYTSYTSVIATTALLLEQTGVYRII